MTMPDMTETRTETTEPSADDENRSIPEHFTEADGGSDDPTERKLSDEAARHRIAARAAETKLTIAEARIAELQRAEVNRHLATKLASANDVWLVPDITLDDMLTNGEVDTDKIDAIAERVLAARPHWKAKWPVGAPASAVTGDGKAPKAAEQPTWAGLLKGNAAG